MGSRIARRSVVTAVTAVAAVAAVAVAAVVVAVAAAVAVALAVGNPPPVLAAEVVASVIPSCRRPREGS